MMQAAALCRLAVVARFTLETSEKRDWPLRHTASEGRKWAATLAAATSAAAFWSSEASKSLITSSADRSGGGDSDSTASAGTRPQGPQHVGNRQRHRFMTHAACYLGKGAEQLLPPAATASLDALEQEPLPSLLTALAEVCRMTPESMLQFVQVLQHGACGQPAQAWPLPSCVMQHSTAHAAACSCAQR